MVPKVLKPEGNSTLYHTLQLAQHTSVRATSSDVQHNPVCVPSGGQFSPSCSSQMTCLWLYIPHQMGGSLLCGLASWSRLVPPLGADRADSVIQTSAPSSPHRSFSSSQNSGTISPSSFSAKQLRPVEGSERTSPQSHHKVPPSPDTKGRATPPHKAKITCISDLC